MSGAAGRILAVVSGKGGVGKSTIAVALATIAARSLRRVVLVDSDPQGGATYASGLDPTQLGLGLSDVLRGSVPADRALAVASDRFLVLGSTPPLVADEGRAEATFPHIRSLLADLVIIDTPPGFGTFAQAAVAQADTVLVPIVLERMATRTGDHVLGLLAGLGADHKLLGFVPTMVEPRRVISALERQRLAELGVPIFDDVPRGVAAAEAPMTGYSVVTHAPRSAPARALERLAARLLPVAP